ncbi:MAG: beta-galactosidase [Anaerolineae bacterium]|nr:beta-galactosidase [Anaerolineae bacterium]
MMSKKFAWLLAAALALSACGPAAPAATPTPTKTLTPAVQPTEAPIDTPAPPTDTPVPTIEEPPTATATAIPATDTPAAEATQPVATDTPVAAATNPPQPSGGFASMRSPDFGAQAFLWWRGEIADRDLTLMKNSGFQWVKQWFAWDDIEAAGKGQYDWSIPDRIVQQTEEHGLKLLVRVDREPAWAGPPPQNTQHLVDFLNALATRYKGRIDAIQIWNEPNLAREWGNQPPNPAQYAQMLRASYQAIKSADPNMIVITAGMAPTGTCCDVAMPDDRFYREMYQAMGGNSDGYFDMLGVHGAGFAAPPEISPDETAANKPLYGGERFFAFRHIEDIRQIMVENGDADKRVVVLEFGWTTDDRPESPYYWHGAGAGIDEATKADYLRRAYEYAKNNWQPWIGLMSLIYMPDIDWTPNDEQYYWSIMAPSQIDQLQLKNSIVVLCAYFNEQLGLPRCQYAPPE